MAFPTLVNSGGGETAVASTSHVITVPSGSVGDLILVILSTAASTSITKPAGWNVARSSGVSTIAQHVVWKIATAASESLTITSTASCLSTHLSQRYSGAAIVGTASMNDGTTGQPSTPNTLSADPVLGKDIVWVATWTETGTAGATSAPTSYGAVTSQNASSVSGVTTSLATRNFTGTYLAGSNYGSTGTVPYLVCSITVEPSYPAGRPYLVGRGAGFRGGTSANGTFTFSGSTGLTLGTDGLDSGCDQYVQSGDLVLVITATGSNTAVQRDSFVGTGDYTKLGSTVFAGNQHSTSMTAYYKILSGADTSFIYNSQAGTAEASVTWVHVYRPPPGGAFTGLVSNSVAFPANTQPDPGSQIPNTPSGFVLTQFASTANGAVAPAGFTIPGSYTWGSGFYQYYTTGTSVFHYMVMNTWNGNSTPIDVGLCTGGAANSTNGTSAAISIGINLTQGEFKIYDGSAWNFKPTKWYNGNAWYLKPVMYWNGTQWVRA